MRGLFQERLGTHHWMSRTRAVTENAYRLGRNRERMRPAPKITMLGPTSASTADFAPYDCSNTSVPMIIATIPARDRAVYVLTPRGGSGILRIARIMFNLLTLHDVKRIVR